MDRRGVFILDGDPPRGAVETTDVVFNIFFTGMWLGHVLLWAAEHPGRRGARRLDRRTAETRRASSRVRHRGPRESCDGSRRSRSPRGAGALTRVPRGRLVRPGVSSPSGSACRRRRQSSRLVALARDRGDRRACVCRCSVPRPRPCCASCRHVVRVRRVWLREPSSLTSGSISSALRSASACAWRCFAASHRARRRCRRDGALGLDRLRRPGLGLLGLGRGGCRVGADLGGLAPRAPVRRAPPAALPRAASRPCRAGPAAGARRAGVMVMSTTTTMIATTMRPTMIQMRTEYPWDLSFGARNDAGASGAPLRDNRRSGVRRATPLRRPGSWARPLRRI